MANVNSCLDVQALEAHHTHNTMALALALGAKAAQVMTALGAEAALAMMGSATTLTLGAEVPLTATTLVPTAEVSLAPGAEVALDHNKLRHGGGTSHMRLEQICGSGQPRRPRP